MITDRSLVDVITEGIDRNQLVPPNVLLFSKLDVTMSNVLLIG